MKIKKIIKIYDVVKPDGKNYSIFKFGCHNENDEYILVKTFSEKIEIKEGAEFIDGKNCILKIEEKQWNGSKYKEVSIKNIPQKNNSNNNFNNMKRKMSIADFENVSNIAMEMSKKFSADPQLMWSYYSTILKNICEHVDVQFNIENILVENIEKTFSKPIESPFDDSSIPF